MYCKQTPFWIKFIIVETMLLGALGAGIVSAQSIFYTGSAQYSTGSYFFEENTESFSIVNGLGWSGEKFNISFHVPYIIQNSPWVSYGVSGFIPTGGPQHKAVRDSSGKGSGKGQQGSGKQKAIDYGPANSSTSIDIPDTTSYTQQSLGDPNVYANITLYNSFSGATSIQLNTGLKVPFADPSNGFGTGKWDYGIGLSVSQKIQNYFFMGHLMKWWFGDLPDLVLKDPFTYSIGIGKSFAGGKWLINGSFNGYTTIIEGYDPPMNVGLGVGYIITTKISLNSTASFGLSESSSDVSIGLGWQIKF